MPEFGKEDLDVKKRKNKDCPSQSNSVDDEWESSSASAPINKRKKFLLDWTCAASEEVGDSEDLHFLGRGLDRRLHEQIAGNTQGKAKIEHAVNGLGRQKICHEPAARKDLIALRRDNLKIEDNNQRNETHRAAVDHCPKPNGKQVSNVPDISLTSTRSYMDRVLEELKNSRKQWIEWMRREMHTLYERSGSSGARMSLVGQSGAEMDEQASHRGTMASRVLGSGTVGMQFGGEGSAVGEIGLTGHGNSGHVVFGHQNNNNAGGISNFGILNSGGGREDIKLSKQHKGANEQMGMDLVGHKNEHMYPVFGLRSTEGLDFGEQNRETAGLVAGLQKSRAGVAGLGRQYSGDGRVGFSPHLDLHGDTGFGAPASTAGGVKYGGQSHGGTGMVFGGQTADNGGHGSGKRVVDIRSSVGLSNSNPSNNGVGNNQCNSLRMSSEERATDLIGMQNVTSVGMQNSMALNMVWSMMPQNGRNDNHGMSESRVPNFNYECGKALNGGIGTYRGMIGHNTGFQNAASMMNPAVMHHTNVALDMKLPSSVPNASPSLNSSGVPILIGMQSQEAIQNTCGIQNFLGLSMNGFTVGASMNRQGFPAFYLQDNPQQAMGSVKGAPITPSPGLNAAAHKRDNGMQGVDILELNT
eukprot:c26458_g1_i1 orf=370-2289(+)